MSSDTAWDNSQDEGWEREVANWEWQRNGDVFRTEGRCPNCTHLMSGEFEKASTTHRVVSVSTADEFTAVWVILRCNCTGAHQGRPAAILNGCGKFVRLQIPVA